MHLQLVRPGNHASFLTIWKGLQGILDLVTVMDPQFHVTQDGVAAERVLMS
jgi:hypothetical protein